MSDRRDRERHDDRHSTRHRDERDRERRDKDHSSRRRDRDRDDRGRDRSQSPSSSSKRHKRPRSQDSASSGEASRDRHRRKDRDRKSSRRETSTERAARKAAKKASRRVARERELEQTAEERLQLAENSFYSATDNPFHDADLGSKFVWGKKAQRDKERGLTVEQARAREAQRRIENQEELEKLNRQRAQREQEQALREEEEARMARMNESAAMAEWDAKEDQFHLEQAMRRAAIRARENRAKPIDYLALNLKWSKKREEKDGEGEDEEEGLDVDLDEPYRIFDNLTLEETEELQDDIKMYLTLETDETNRDFWKSMLVVSTSVLEDLQTARRLGSSSTQSTTALVKGEITTMLRNKTHEQLVALQKSIRQKLASDERIDREYWEGLGRECIVWMAKSKLRDLHERVLQNRLEQLRAKQRDQAARVQNELLQETVGGPSGAAAAGGEEDMDMDDEEEEEEMEEPEAYEPEMSPEPVEVVGGTDRQFQILHEEVEKIALYDARRAVATARFIVAKKPEAIAEEGGGADSKAEEMFEAEAAKGLDEEEELFDLEAQVGKSKPYMWEDKYRPRKPRYFNRIHTGFEWNKYNQTHYDTDNPPPKVVQGYKFSVFYPDLVDPTKTPTYRIVKEPGQDETRLLVFEAGPPYENVAFRIVNKEWDYSHKRGFRSSFQGGVLQLHFTFKRLYYRK